jgi:hypothetical protein
MGEVVGTAVEAPMRILFRISVVKGHSIEEPQYETDDYYATTGFGTTIDEAALKATRYMIKHIEGRGFAPCAGNNAYSQRRLCIPSKLMPDNTLQQTCESVTAFASTESVPLLRTAEVKR